MKTIKSLLSQFYIKSIYALIVMCGFRITVILLFIIHCSLFTANAQDLWGMTTSGGEYNCGTLFEFNVSTSTFTKKVDFDGTNKGCAPFASLMQACNGKLYGMTPEGGTNGEGVLFEYDPNTKTFTKKLDFDGTNTGSNPGGNLMQASNGKFYGTTINGGANGYGVIFEYDLTANTLTKIVNFDRTHGAGPKGTLLQASNGMLYGETQDGGTSKSCIPGCGVLFKYDLVTSTYSNTIDYDGTKYGAFACGNLIQATNGKLYGVTNEGGTSDNGVILEYDPLTDNISKTVDFDGINGQGTVGSLTQAINGKIYGMTEFGGSNGEGVLFEYDPAEATLSVKINFDGTSNGNYPSGNLIQASNGKLYGMTGWGGTNKIGVLFEFDPKTNNFIKEIDFNGTNGSYPTTTSLIEFNYQSPTTPIISTNSPLCEGDTLKIHASETCEATYIWIGPNHFTSDQQNPFIPNVTNAATGTYKVKATVNDSTSLPDSIYVTILAPVKINSTNHNQSQCLDSSIAFTLNAASGTTPFSYQWLLNGTAISQATNFKYQISHISNTDSGKYSCIISNVCNSVTGDVVSLTPFQCVRFRHNISGYVTYDNKAKTPLSSKFDSTVTNVYLYNSGDTLIGKTQTDDYGYYEFVNIINGEYLISGSTVKAWGGSNPTDALIVNRNYIGMYNFTDSLLWHAGDVDSSCTLNPTDALIINRRYIGLLTKYAKVGDWKFQKIKVVMAGENLTQNIKAVCTGDVNASYAPYLIPGRVISYKLGVMSNISINIDVNKPFDIPVYLNDNVELGAVGIKLLITNDKLQIISIKSGLDGLIYNLTENQESRTKNQEINVAWAAENEGYSVTPDKPLFVVSCSLIVDSKSSSFQLPASNFRITSESVLADIDANIISTDKLAIPEIIETQSLASLQLQIYPNPFNNITNINYTLPEDANVELNIYNVLGEKVAALVTTSTGSFTGFQKAGQYYIKFDGSNLKQGIYYLRCTIYDSDKVGTDSRFNNPICTKTNILIIAR